MGDAARGATTAETSSDVMQTDRRILGGGDGGGPVKAARAGGSVKGRYDAARTTGSKGRVQRRGDGGGAVKATRIRQRVAQLAREAGLLSDASSASESLTSTSSGSSSGSETNDSGSSSSGDEGSSASGESGGDGVDEDESSVVRRQGGASRETSKGMATGGHVRVEKRAWRGGRRGSERRPALGGRGRASVGSARASESKAPSIGSLGCRECLQQM